MFVVPNDLQESGHRVFDFDFAGIVAYRTMEAIDGLKVLFLHPTLISVRRGQKVISSHGGRYKIVLQPGDSVLLPPGSRVNSEVLQDERYESTVISLNPSLLAGRDWGTEKGNGRAPVRVADDVSSLVQQFRDVLDRGLKHSIIENRFHEIVSVLQDDPATSAVLASAAARVNSKGASRLREVMETHFKEPLRLSDYARLCGRSLASFKRDFSKEYGESPGEWLVSNRLDYAADLLRSSDLSVTEVCFESGFGDLSNFIRAFGRHFDKTPKQFQLSG